MAQVVLVALLAAPAAGAEKRLWLWSGNVDVGGLSQADDGRPAVWVVQARETAGALRAELERREIVVLGYLDEDAYLVEASRPQLKSLGGRHCFGRLEAGWKIAPAVAGLTPGSRLRLAAWPGRALGDLADTLAGLGRLLRQSRDAAGTDHALVEAAGDARALAARVAELPFVAWIEPERRTAFGNDDSAWVIQGGDASSGATPLFARGLAGAGQIIAVADSGLDGDACQFRLSAAASAQTLFNQTQPPAAQVTDPGNKVISYYLLSGADAYDDFSKQGHGTHVAGSAAGDNYAHLASDSDAGRDSGDGMAPAARLVIQDTGRRDGVQAGLPDSLLDLFRQAYDSGARVHNNSYGKTEADSLYGSDSREVDDAAWRLQDLVIVFSSGNLGPGAGTLDGLGSTAKNSVVVGASLAGVSNDGYGVCHFSSQGPTADGRLRPDLVAPGAVRSARETDWISRGGTDIFGNPTADSTTDPPNGNCALDASFRVGTSFAAPLVAGAAALVRQYFEQGFYPAGTGPAGGFAPSAALIKAVLINSAESIGPAPNSVPGPLYDVSRGEKISDLEAAPNNIEGWGLLRLGRSLVFAGGPGRLAVLADVWNDGQERGAAGGAPLEEGGVRQWVLRAVAAGSLLRLTLCWTDPAGTAGTGRALVNDLDLEVEAGGQLYRGNVNLVENRSQPASGMGPDGLNPLEQVLLELPASGDVLVRVVARSVPGNGAGYPYPSWRQGYALVAVGDFAGVCAGESCGPADGGGGDGYSDGSSGDADAAATDGDGGADLPRVVGGCSCGGPGRGPTGLFLLPWLYWRRRR